MREAAMEDVCHIPHAQKIIVRRGFYCCGWFLSGHRKALPFMGPKYGSTEDCNVSNASYTCYASTAYHNVTYMT